MAKTRAELVTELKYLLGNRDDLDSDLIVWVRRAYQAVTKRIELRESVTTHTFTTVVGTPSYTLPSDYFAAQALYNNTSSVKLAQDSQEKFLKLDLAATGSVERYAIMGSAIWFYKKPDAIESILMWYRKRFADLTADGSVHALALEWEQPLVWEAASYGYEALGEVERAAMMRARVTSFIAGQQRELEEALWDRNEAVEVVGLGDLN